MEDVRGRLEIPAGAERWSLSGAPPPSSLDWRCWCCCGPVCLHTCASSSVPSGMAALDSKASGKMGMRAVIYYMTTTFIAVFIGILIVLIIHPGKGSKEEFGKQKSIEQVSPADAFLDLIR